MTFFEKVQYQMNKKGVKNINQLSSQIGIPYTTIRHWDGVPSDVVRYSNIKALSQFFDVPEMYWADGTVTPVDTLTKHEQEVLEAYRRYEHKEAIDSILGLKKSSGESTAVVS